MGAIRGVRTLHLDIVDYAGEWLLDLTLMDRSYADWSRDVTARIAERDEAADFRTLAGKTDATQPFDEVVAKALAESFTGYLTAARAAGYSDCTPGRFLLPGDLAGSPVLTFAPLPGTGVAPRGSLLREMERRFEAYRAKVVKPFFRDHFVRIDRQIVLVDALGAIHAGPRAVEDMRQGLNSDKFRRRAESLKKLWCVLLTEAFESGTRTTQQGLTHRWTIHPMVDGCEPEGGGGGLH